MQLYTANYPQSEETKKGIAQGLKKAVPVAPPS